jgi:two-component system chemotaxis response regulator CheB
MPAYDLIAIGASWGGLEALERILGGLPRDFPLPIVIAQHRAAASGLGKIGPLLERVSGHSVREAEDKDAIERGGVYVAPADYHLLVERGSLALSTEGLVHNSRPSIDVLFESAADAYGERLIGVILTGLNQDGAQGIVRIRRRGGLTIAQDPATAVKAKMPEAAIATGAVDRVVPLDEIAPLLLELARSHHPHARGRAA